MTANQIRASYPSYYNWRNAYHVHTSNGKSILLKKEGKNKDDTVPVSLESMQQVVPYEHLFGFLMQHHRPDHCRGRTFHDRCSKASSNITRAVTQLFTDTCCRCIEQIKRKKPTAGHQPILTYGFGARGQVDMVDMQSMPDGVFKFLLDYTDHGNKLQPFYSNYFVSLDLLQFCYLIMVESFPTRHLTASRCAWMMTYVIDVFLLGVVYQRDYRTFAFDLAISRDYRRTNRPTSKPSHP